MCTTAALPCPLCCQTNFPSVDALRMSLVSVSSRLLQCPICNEMLMGLDKLTIHLFSHTLHNTNGHHSNSNNNAIEPQQQLLLPQQHQLQPAAKTASHKHPHRSTVAAQRRHHHCHVCGCTFRNHELHQMHMQLVHDITIEDDDDDDPITDDTDGDTLEEGNIGADISMERAHFAAYQQQQHQPEAHQPLFPQQQHGRLFGGIPPTRHQCHMCPKSYKLKGSLRVHMRVVHDGACATKHVPPMPLNVPSAASLPSTVVCTIPITFHDGMTSTCSNDNDQLSAASKSIVISMGVPPTTELLAPTAETTTTTGQSAAATDHRNGAGVSASNNAESATSKLWECDICAKWFKTMYYLKKHKRLHTGETPYTCEHCGKTFTFQQSYHKHLLYHTDDKPHVCLTCGRAFKEMSTLHNHERIHSGEKPFKCETCDKTFRQRVSCLVHRRIHTGVMPYKCTACDKSFRYKVSQRTHKCPSQPPGEVVRQTDDLLQRLIQNSLLNDIQNDAAVAVVGTENNADRPMTDASHGLSADEKTTAMQMIDDSASENCPSSSALSVLRESHLVETMKMEDQHQQQQQQQQQLLNCDFPNNQSLDAFVVQHCNLIGIGDEPVETPSLPDNTELRHQDHNENTGGMMAATTAAAAATAEQQQQVPSPVTQFQNMCLYSPTGCGEQERQITSQGDVETYSSSTLDALDEVALSHFMNEIN